jgi:glutamate racemase
MPPRSRSPAVPSPLPPSPPTTVGVFDSGVGGLSVLQAVRRLVPWAPLLYVADSGHAPYGDKDVDHVMDRTRRVVDHLVAQGAQLVVIACNTATAWAIDAMRARHRDVDFVGVEPGVKPAALMSPNRRFAVMATPSTLASERYADLVRRHAPGCEVIPVACAGLAAAIEQGDAGTAEVERLLDLYCQPLVAQAVDLVVLGCTHYPFVADRIARRLDSRIVLLDTADAVARRVRDLLCARVTGPSAPPNGAMIRLQTTGETDVLERLARVELGLQVAADPIGL